MNKKPDKLYVLKCGNRYKIGITSDITQRVLSLQVGNADVITVEYIEERYNPIKAEKWLHKQFASKKVKGEWFENITLNEIRSRLLMFHDQEPNPNEE